MGKQKFDRMKKVTAILLACLFVTSLSAVAVAAVASYGGSGHGGHGGFGGGYGGYGGFGGGWGGPFGFYPPAPYGTAPGSCACGPYGCFCAPDYTYLVQAIIAENGW